MQYIYTKPKFWHDSENKNKYYIKKNLNKKYMSKKVQSWLKMYFKYKKQNALDRHILFNLDESKFIVWYSQTAHKCHYCGLSAYKYTYIRRMILNYHGDNEFILNAKNTIFCYKWVKKHNKLTLDRIDNSKGYIEKNICKCCWICNRLKLKQEATKKLYIELKNYSNKLYNSLRDVGTSTRSVSG